MIEIILDATVNELNIKSSFEKKKWKTECGVKSDA